MKAAKAFAIVAALLAPTCGAVAQEAGGVSPDPQVRRLSDNTFAIGAIRVDAREHRFSVPGRVLRREPPLEYLAVTRGGSKGYESLLELDATAYEFNLACILVGLDAANSELPDYQFDEDPVVGQPVGIVVTWEADGETVRAPAASLLRAADAVVEEHSWAYIGSTLLPDGRYFADLAGTLIGFVHDPASIIEHSTGLGIGEYGLIAGNDGLVPEAGTAVMLSVQLLQPSGEQAHADAGEEADPSL